MTDHEGMVDVVLIGGPGDLPDTLRATRIAAAKSRTKIKIEHRSGYEHFEPATEASSSGPLVFHWAGSTKIAE
jgi:hypothetical protein